MKAKLLTMTTCCVGITVLLAACTGGGNAQAPAPTTGATTSPTSTPALSPTPTLSDEEAAQQTNVAAAQARYEEYLAASDGVLAAPTDGNPLDRIRLYIGSEEMVTWWTSVPQQFADQGLHQEGASALVSTTVTGYEGEPLGDGTQVVALAVCIDGTGVRVVDASGSPAQTSNAATTPIVSDVVMQRQPDKRWTVQKEAPRQPFEEC